MKQFNFRKTSSCLLLSLTLLSTGGLQAQAVQLADGTVYFTQVPRLVKARTTFNDIRVWGATYYFTLSIPEKAGEPLQKVTFSQHEGVDNVEFNRQLTRAFTQKKEQLLTIGQVREENKRTLSVIFDPPVPPGNTITIALKPYHNPNVSGVYLFGVTAFPQGEKAHGQFLGYGRLHFYDSFNSFSPFRSWWH